MSEVIISDYSYRWLWGVFLAVGAAVISNLGLTLQKLSHKRNLQSTSTHAEEHKSNYHKDPTWATGLGLVILGSVADLLALGFAAQSIVAPLGSLTLVSNVLLAPLFLGEQLDRRDLLATFAIVFGSAISVIFAAHEEIAYSVSDLFAFYLLPRFFVYAVLVVLLCFVFLYYIGIIEQNMGDSVKYASQRSYHRLLYSALSGVIGAQSVLFAKCFAELVVTGLMRQGNFGIFLYYQTYLVVIAMVTCILLQIKYMNSALLRFDSVTVVPIFQSFWILVSVIAGLVFFGEASNFSVYQAIMFPLGVLITLGGIYFLSLRSASAAEMKLEQQQFEMVTLKLDSVNSEEIVRQDEMESSPLVHLAPRAKHQSDCDSNTFEESKIEVNLHASDYLPIRISSPALDSLP